MPLHLIKLCVGASSIDDQRAWIKTRIQQNKSAGRGETYDCVTRMRPKRRDELLDGGSLYWVIKGTVAARQKILDLKPRIGADGIERTAIIMTPDLILTAPQQRRAFQGWRYLTADDAPGDLELSRKGTPPPELAKTLSELGLM